MKGKEGMINSPILYVAIGNSLTAGVGAGYFPGFVQRYQQMAAQHLNKRVMSQVYARPGATTSDLLQMVRHPNVARAIQQASIITINAGGNDLIQASPIYFRTKERRVLEDALKNCQENVTSIIDEIRELKRDSQSAYMIRILDLYNPFPEEKLAEKWVKGLNRHLKKMKNGHLAITNLYTAFKGKEEHLLAADKIHPNAKGYQLISEQLHLLGYSPLMK